MTVKPLTKIIFLSVLLSIGILLVVLSCALFHNYNPLYVIAVFLIAPIPNAIFSSLNASYQSDFLSDSSVNGNGIKDLGEFMTGIFVFSGLVLPIVLWHVHLIVFWAMIMSLSGGFIVYTSIILFSMFFNMSDEDEGFDF